MGFREQFWARVAYYHFYYELSTCISMLEPWEKPIANVILLVLLSAVIALMHCVMPILGQCVGAVLVVVIDRSPLMDAVQFSSGLGNAVVWSN